MSGAFAIIREAFNLFASNPDPIWQRQLFWSCVWIASIISMFAAWVIELLQIQTPSEREFIEKKIEAFQGNYAVPLEDKKFILRRLTESESLERFIHTRYVAQKRF